MFFYSVPYLNPDENSIQTYLLPSEVKLTLIDVLIIFLEEIKHSYIDENYGEYPVGDLLNIAYETYNISSIMIFYTNKEQVLSYSSFDVKHVYQSYFYSQDIKTYLSTCSEIVITSDSTFDEPETIGEVSSVINGLETTLFTYVSGDDDIVEEDDEEEFETGITLPEFLDIDSPVLNQEELLGLFSLWATKIGLDLEDKTVRFLRDDETFDPSSFEKSMMMYEEYDPEFKYSIPEELMFWSKEEIPSFEELIEILDNQTPETIACVLENFKDQTVVNILEALGDRKQLVLEVYPLMPALEKKELERMIRLFPYEDKFVFHRLKVLSEKYGGNIHTLESKMYLNEIEKRDLNEFLTWREWCMKK